MVSWFALRVLRGNYERSVQRQLREAGIEEFLPLYSIRSKWSDRIKIIERPLFPGYLFARTEAAAAGELLRLTGQANSLQLLPSNLNPQAVPDLEVETLVKLCFSSFPLLPAEYRRGQMVTVTDGALAGVSGVVSKVRSQYRLTVNIEIFHRAVEVELDAAAVASCR